MISRKHRFHGQKDIKHIYKRGRTVRAGFMGAKTLASKNDDYRLAVVVSRKVNRSAVTRNRIRRRLYEAVRLIRKDLGRSITHDVVLTVYDDKVYGLPAPQLRQACENLLRQIERPK